MSTDPAPASERPRLTAAQARCLRRLAAGERATGSTTRWLALERRGLVIYCGFIALGRNDRWAISDKGRAYLATLDEPARQQAGGEGDGA